MGEIHPTNGLRDSAAGARTEQQGTDVAQWARFAEASTATAALTAGLQS